MNIENKMGTGVPPQETPKSEDTIDQEITEPEKGVENLDSTLGEIENKFLNLQNKTEEMSTDEEGYDIIRRLEGLYDKTLDLSNEIGYQPMTGKNKFATPTAIANERKIKPLRNRIHNFLMDEAWEKRDQLKSQQK